MTRHLAPGTFEEYAAARASALYRTAYLLTGSRPDAEDLVQVTLIKLYLAWERVSRADSPDAYARRVLTHAFISGRRPARFAHERLVVALPQTPVRDLGVEDRLTIWPHLVALPPRQRAVIVLRYYSGLAEAEIAEVLGIARGTVTSTASAALATLRTPDAGGPVSDLEDLLTRELGEVAERERAPRLDLAGLRRLTRDVRRRRASVAVGAAAAGIVAVAGLSVTLSRGAGPVDPARSPDPISFEDLPLGGPLRLTWQGRDDVVHLAGGGTLLVDDVQELATSGGTTVVGVGPDTSATRTYSLVDSTGAEPRLVPLYTRLAGSAGSGMPSLGPDGRYLAWAVETSRTSGEGGVASFEVTRYDAATAATSTVGVDAGVGSRSGTVDYVPEARVAGADGTITLDTEAGALLWRVGSPPAAAPGLPSGGYFVSDDLYLHHPPGSRIDVLSRVAADATTELLPALPGRAAYAFSPDASAFVGLDDGDDQFLVTLRPDGTSTRGATQLPSTGAFGWNAVGWESSTVVVFSQSIDRSGRDLVRCSVTTDECEAVPSRGLGIARIAD